MPKLDEEYIKTGKLKYALVDFPIESIHRNAFKASEATYCALDQGKYWEMHDRLFANQAKLNRPDLSDHAKDLGLNVATFDQCLDGGKHTARVRKTVLDVQKVGISGTPTFLLGITDPKSSQLKAVRVVRGAQAFDNLKATIDDMATSAK